VTSSKSQESPSVAEELRSLLDTIAASAEPLLQKVGTNGKQQPYPPTAACNWCPLCASLALMRGQRPELAVRAAEHAAGLLAVFRAAMQEQDSPEHRSCVAEDQDPHRFAEPAEPAQPRTRHKPPARQRVQKIELRRPGGAGGPGRPR
jgi:hypothetical protein